MISSAAIILCRLGEENYRALGHDFNPRIARHIVQALRAAGLHPNLLAGGYGFISSKGNIMFIKMDIGQLGVWERTREITAKLDDGLRRFLHSPAFAGIMSFYIQKRAPSCSRCDIGDRLQTLDIETCGNPAVVKSRFSLQGIQAVGEETLRNWK